VSRSYAEASGIKPYRYERGLHAPFGQLARIGERLVCHLCGRDFIDLAAHVRRAHGLDAPSYRRAFGLNAKTRLMTDSLRSRHREIALRQDLEHAQSPEQREAALKAAVEASTRREDRSARLEAQLTRVATTCPRGHEEWVMKGKKRPQRHCAQCNRDAVKAWRLAHPDKYQQQRLRRAAERRRKRSGD
jgi:hypothetical protein